MSASTIRKGHVNFGCHDDNAPKDNSITIKEIIPGHVQVHLGFLQYHRIYKISIEFPKSHFQGRSLKSILEAAEKSVPNVNCKVLSIDEKNEFFNLVVEFFARKERLLKEELVFDFEREKNIVIEFNARVLGPGKGTPLLRNGIKCIGIDPEELSDVSDWQAD